MGNMFQYASAISRQFAITYLMKKKFSEAHENGDIYIHGMNFIPTGTTSSCQIDISKLYDDGFYIGNNYIKEPNGIIAYSNLATVAIQANQMINMVNKVYLHLTIIWHQEFLKHLKSS